MEFYFSQYKWGVSNLKPRQEYNGFYELSGDADEKTKIDNQIHQLDRFIKRMTDRVIYSKLDK